MNLDHHQYYYGPHTLALTRPEFYHDEEHFDETDVLFIGFSCDNVPFPLHNGLFYDIGDHLLMHLLEKMKREMIAQKLHYSISWICWSGNHH